MSVFYEDIHKASAEYPYIDSTNFDIDYVLHIHEETEIVYVTEGDLIVLIDAKTIKMKQGDICIITPGRIHTLVPTGHNHTYIMKLYPQANLSEIKLQKDRLSKDDEEYKAFKALIDKIIEENDKKSKGYQLAVNILSSQIQLEILRFMPYKKITSTEMMSIGRRKNILDAVNAYMEKNYTNEITLEGAAKCCGYSKYYFSRTFKSIINMGFWEYYNDFKIKKAAFMLKNTDESVTQIATHCGFNSLRSFNRVFKKTFGCTPKGYRYKETLTD